MACGSCATRLRRRRAARRRRAPRLELGPRARPALPLPASLLTPNALTGILRHEPSATQTGHLGGLESRQTARVPGGSPGRRGLRPFLAQGGSQHPAAKRLKGDLRGLVEVVENHASGTYRAVYTAKLANAIYVLHVFQKKATRGIATPKHELELIRPGCGGPSNMPAARRESDEDHQE